MPCCEQSLLLAYVILCRLLANNSLWPLACPDVGILIRGGSGARGDWSWCRAVYLIILIPTAHEMPTPTKAYMLKFWNIVRNWVIPFKGSGGIIIFLSEICNTKPTSPWWQARSWIRCPEAEEKGLHQNSLSLPSAPLYCVPLSSNRRYTPSRLTS